MDGPGPALTVAVVGEVDVPLGPLLTGGPGALAIITGTRGPSYRCVGAAMAVAADGRHWGSLSSGCLERDVIAHAQQAMADGQPRRLRYGEGSPFLDITLPCGGTLDITVVPHPDREALSQVAARLARRQVATLMLRDDGTLATDGVGLTLRILPHVRFIVFGSGAEAATFAALARAASYPVELFSPDGETVAAAGFGTETVAAGWPEGLFADPFTAVTLFFHDHDREIALLHDALTSPAFYVGAQGSLRAHNSRRAALMNEGLADDVVARLASPFGLIPSTRDARTLAVSVLADVLARGPGGARAGGEEGV